LIITLWSLVPPSTVCAAGPQTSSDEFDPAFHLVGDAVAKHEVPGAVALVARGGKIIRYEAYGLRDIENQLPFTNSGQRDLPAFWKSRLSDIDATIKELKKGKVRRNFNWLNSRFPRNREPETVP